MSSSEVRFCDMCSKDISYKNLCRHVKTNAHKRNIKILIANEVRLGHIFPFHRSQFPEVDKYKEIIDIGDFGPSAIFKEEIVYNIEHKLTTENLSISDYMKLIKSNAISQMKTALERNISNDAQFYLTISLLNMFTDERKEFYKPLRREVVYKHININKLGISQRDRFIDELDNRDLSHSGLTFYGLKVLEILLFRNTSDGRCSYFELSDDIKNKKALINVKNTDSKCFMWRVLAGLHPQDIHPERISKYTEWGNELNFKGIRFPVSVSQVE